MKQRNHPRLYDSVRWLRLRAAHLAREPLCRYCARQGLVVQATVVDHIARHRGDKALFFDGKNLQSLCKTCHDSVKQREELGQTVHTYDTHGMPMHAAHPWNMGLPEGGGGASSSPSLSSFSLETGGDDRKSSSQIKPAASDHANFQTTPLGREQADEPVLPSAGREENTPVPPAADPVATPTEPPADER